jgi:diguanylate cyclase (GGDEF)-like protein
VIKVQYEFPIKIIEYYTINKLSFGAIIDAILAMILFVVFFVSYVFILKTKLAYFISKLFFFIFLTALSFAFFTNATTVSNVSFWHKLCFVSSYMIYYTTIQINEINSENHFTTYKNMMKVIIFIVILLLSLNKGYILGKDVIFTNYPHLQKGKFFVLFMYIIPIIVIYSYYKFLRKYILKKKNEGKWILIPIVYDVLIIFIFILAVASIKLNTLQNSLWIFLLVLFAVIMIVHIKNQNKLSKDLEELIKEKEFLNEKLAKSSLTDVYSRSYVRDIYDSYMCKDNEYNCCKGNEWIAFVDIDNFKKVNDFYGHIVGDKVLKAFGRILLDNSKEGYLPARYGGDEFFVFIKVASKNEIEEYFDKILLEFKKNLHNILNDSNKFSVGLSIGIVDSDNMSLNFQESIMLADNLMYKAKAKGGNQYYFIK